MFPPASSTIALIFSSTRVTWASMPSTQSIARLISSKGASALDGVYKLVSIQNEGDWVPAIKISESPHKTVTPGHKQVVRVYDERGLADADVMALEFETLEGALHLRHPIRHDFQRVVPAEGISEVEPLLVPVWDNGRVSASEPIETARDRRVADLERLDPGVRRFMNPHVYHVSLTQDLWTLRQDTIEDASDGQL